MGCILGDKNVRIGRMTSLFYYQHRQCICGVPIRMDRELCICCLELYGKRRKDRPEWVNDWLRSYQRELEYEQKHPTLSLDAILDVELE